LQNSPKHSEKENSNDVPDVADLYKIAEEACIPVVCVTMASQLECFAVLLPEDGVVIAMDPEKVHGQGDEKYKLAHELGHSLTGAFYSSATPMDEKGRAEQRADRWAIECLLPFPALEEAVASGRTQLYDLAEFFQLPQAFLEKAIAYYTGPKGLTLPRE
jgi:hypothetical protein